jgi:PAS domain S-box-containing protein
MNKMQAFIKNLLEVPTTDPDNARLGKLLNILLAGIFVCAIAGLILVLVTTTIQEASWMLAICVVLLIGVSLIYLLNRKHSQAAAFVFLLLLTAAFTFSDTAQEVTIGRSLFVFAIPIAIASLLIHPTASFIFSGLTAAILIGMAQYYGLEINTPAIIGYLMLGLVSWLSARSLDQALSGLREVNANLDKLVQERTQALVAALGRERIEAGRIRAILDSIADGVIVFDVHGKAIRVNPALVRLLEVDEGHLSQTNVEELTRSKALDAKNRGILAALLTSPGQQITSYRVQWAKKTLSVSSAQVADIEGERIGTVAVFRDYTREAEVERMKNTFLAIVSHELRTPLNAILGYAEMFKEAIYGPVNEKQIRASDRILSNVRRLLDIVSDLLDQAQIEAGKMTIQARPFKPTDLIDNVHGVMDKIAADKGVALTSEIDPELPETVNGDPARLQQILVNLTNNAIKFTDKGSVHMRVYRADKKHWGLEVLDTGIGIPDEELPHIFEAFHQVDSTATRRHGGFGLGLSIVQQLAHLMGGNIAVKSKMGVGSIFTITLPLTSIIKRRAT